MSQPTLRREGNARLTGASSKKGIRGVATNVYFEENVGKTGKDVVYELLGERFGSCIYARGRY